MKQYLKNRTNQIADTKETIQEKIEKIRKNLEKDLTKRPEYPIMKPQGKKRT